MPNRSPVMRTPRIQEDPNITNAQQPIHQANVRLPEIQEGSSKVKSEKKTSRFLGFSNERHSFTENLLSFFTGNRESSNRAPSRPPVAKKPVPTTRKVKNGQGFEENKFYRYNSSNDVKTGKANAHHNNNIKHNGHHVQKHKHPPLKRTSGKKITASAKDQAFRPVTSNSTKPAENEKPMDVEAGSDIGGYEYMHKTKQPAGKLGKSRKHSSELSEYLRRENYRYNERVAKQFLFQKWLRSTETEFPDNFSAKENDPLA